MQQTGKLLLFKVHGISFGKTRGEAYFLYDGNDALIIGECPQAAALCYGRKAFGCVPSPGRMIALSTAAFSVNRSDGRMTCIKNRYGLNDDPAVYEEVKRFSSFEESRIASAALGWPDPVLAEVGEVW